MQSASAQEISFKDTITSYNTHRLNINKAGMKVLGLWGIANIAAGSIGYFTAKQDEWKYFHEMNVIWGMVNTGIAAMGMAGVRKELNVRLSYERSYDRYRANKKLYLVNAGLDVLYIATGVGLTEYSVNAKTDAAIYRGFGRSIAIQGVFLLLFDNVMFAAHQQSNSNWYRIMNEIHVSNAGIGFIHTF
ncbi:MAG: DUF6992 family protein [Chitinophagales bacterium]